MENPFKKFIIGAAMLASVTASEGVNAQSGGKVKPLQEKEYSITEKTRWVDDLMKEIREADTSRLTTGERAQNFERVIIKRFVNNLGASSDSAEINANYSLKDYQYIKKQFDEITKIFLDLEKRFSEKGDAFTRTGQWTTMSKLLGHKSTQEWWDEQKKMEKMIADPYSIDRN